MALQIELQKAALLGFIDLAMEHIIRDKKPMLEKRLTEIMTTMVEPIDLSKDAFSPNCWCVSPMNNGIDYCSGCGKKIL